MHSVSVKFTHQQKINALIFLTFFHILVITASNYLVQMSFPVTLPLHYFGLQDFTFLTTWGTLTFPFIFLATDLTVRIFGAKLARKIILAVMLPALVISYVISTLFDQAQYQGLSALAHFNGFVFRIALASFSAYVVGQLLDVTVFNRLRQLKIWWVAPTCSMVFGSMADTYVFFAVAFYASSDAFMAANWVEIGIVDYCFKLFIGLLLFVPTYGVLLTMIMQKLRQLKLNKTLPEPLETQVN